MEVVLCLLFVLYLLPFAVAARRDHERLGAILAANLLLGWTGIGWLAVLRWARRPVLRAPEPVVQLRRGHLRLLGSPPAGPAAGAARGPEMQPRAWHRPRGRSQPS